MGLFRTLRSLHKILLLLGATITLNTACYSHANSHSQSDLIEFDIPPQPLHAALTLFAEQADIQILFQENEIPQTQSNSLKGKYSAAKALHQLIENTSLKYRFGASNVVVIYIQTLKNNQKESVVITPQTTPPSADKREIEEILITGFRSSIARSIAIKKFHSNFSDSISVEDIGKFPDKNIADALQRVPGVSVDRVWGEGRDINIRGTDKDVNRTLLNGQNVASAYWWANDSLGRGFNYSILASELVDTVEIIKSPRADLDEGSIGGSVYLKTRYPLAYEQNNIRTSLETQYSSLPDKWNPQTSLLINWTNQPQNFGFITSLNYQERSVRRDGLETFPRDQSYSITDENNNTYEEIHIPWGIGSAIFQQERKRFTGHTAIQWQPLSNLDIKIDAVRSNMDMDNSNQNYLALFDLSLLDKNTPVEVFRPQITSASNGKKHLVSGTLGTNQSELTALDAIFREAKIETEFYDIDITYEYDSFVFHSQLGMTKAKGGSDHDYLFRFTGNSGVKFNLAPKAIEFKFLDIDPVDDSDKLYLSNGSRDWVRSMQDKENFAQFDATYFTDAGLLNYLKAGVKVRDRTTKNRRAIGIIPDNHSAWETPERLSLIHYTSTTTPKLHQETATENSLTQYAMADFDLLNQGLLQYQNTPLFFYQDDPSSNYTISELISTAYLMADISYKQLDMDFGVRWSHTDQTSEGINLKGQTTIVERDYQNILPNFNLKWTLTDMLLARFSAAKVMARPSFTNLTSNVIIDGESNNATAGNPYLKPYSANQSDLGLEWYFSDSALLAANIFYKKLSTFLFIKSSVEDIDGTLVNVGRPQNAPALDIFGLELQWHQPLWKGLGITSNYTYTEPQTQTYPGIDSINLPGNSKDQLNASLFYENNDLSARVSYNYRSQSYGGFTGGSQDVTDEYYQWDASLQWSLTSNLDIYLNVINFTNEIVNYNTSEGIPIGFYENGRRISLGAKFILF
ncbi:TonB-dependent receptor [Teredinibacter sp. KSP-S5-2]|uniref:TonB-dependent receptor n=1 Tax=Teredinibacter sp. KSP-S5-2 TaxID=3034506 RepID=UPI0029352254|nr:TonB-dependent receptor [Teredinibacter sp. KSP-S5-2]WNO07620.1 TonB-dependent receptor [Teredinibacter sp. KSP-S5-2]